MVALEGWLTLEEAATRIGVSVRTVQRWASSGELRTVHRARLTLTRPEWIDEFLLSGSGLERSRPIGAVAARVALFGLAFLIGAEVEAAWRVEWHPFGLDVDSAVAIAIAMALLLAGQAGLERLLRRRRRRRLERHLPVPTAEEMTAVRSDA